MSLIAALAVFGFCTTTVQKEKVCTPIVTIDPQDHLIDKCPAWAKSVNGKGWGYVNSQDAKELAEKQKSQCQRFEEIDRGEPYACAVDENCEGRTSLLTLDVTVKALTDEQALDRCLNLGVDQYKAALKHAAAKGCWIRPTLLKTP